MPFNPSVDKNATGDAIQVDGSSFTQPISAVSLPLPTGAATETTLSSLNGKDFATQTTLALIKAKTDNLDVALSTRTKPADTQTISGTVTANAGTNLNTSALALNTTVAALQVAQGSATAGESGSLVQGAVTTAAPTYTTAQTSPLSLTTTGALRVDNSANTQPISGTVTANIGTTNGLALNSDLQAIILTPGANDIGQKGPVVLGAVTVNSPAYTTGTLNKLSLTTSGALRVQQSPNITTYSAAMANVASAATATDIFTIFGSGTKTIKVHRIFISGTQTTAGEINFLLIKRSTANTAGTSAAATLVPNDSTNAAATATILSYTANPTLGTTVGSIRTAKLFAPAVGSVVSAAIFTETFGQDFVQPIVLRGTAQGLCVNLNSTTIAGGSFNFAIEWTEE